MPKNMLPGIYTTPVTLTNEAYTDPVTVTGTMSLSAPGVDLLALSPWSVVNAGRILSPGSSGTGTGTGIILQAGGSVDNQSGGYLNGARHGVALYAAGTVTNTGTIISTLAHYGAVALDAGGVLINQTGGFISGAIGGYVFGGGTVMNAGTMAGGGIDDTALVFVGGQTNRLVIDRSAVFIGEVDGGNTAGSGFVSALELAAGTASLTGIGSQFTHFGSIAFDPGAAWFISGYSAALAGGQSITGFARGDTIELTGVSATVTGFTAGTLALSDGLNLLLPDAHYSAAQFQAVQNGENTDLSIACFRAGTRILTERGELPVEAIYPGLRVVSLPHRRLLPVRWVGRRRIDCTRHPCADAVWPVRVLADALAPGVPHRDLFLSPDHALLAGDRLVPVRHLLNGGSIAQMACDEVTYIHVELAEHGVLLAEGAPAESYLDTGNRAAFSNGGAAVAMHPDFSRRVWQAKGCAELTVSGAPVVAECERLLARATGLGWRTTDAAAPLLLARIAADTQEILLPLPMRGEQAGQRTASFALPADVREVTLCSRASVPAQLDPTANDHRRLGLAVVAVELDDVPIPLDDARLTAGWHAAEKDLRWTDGGARIEVAGARLLTVRYVPLLKYWVQRSGRPPAANFAGKEEAPGKQ